MYQYLSTSHPNKFGIGNIWKKGTQRKCSSFTMDVNEFLMMVQNFKDQNQIYFVLPHFWECAPKCYWALWQSFNKGIVFAESDRHPIVCTLNRMEASIIQKQLRVKFFCSIMYTNFILLMYHYSLSSNIIYLF